MVAVKVFHWNLEGTFLYLFSLRNYTGNRSAVLNGNCGCLTLWYLVWCGSVCFGGPYVRFVVPA